MEQVQVVDILTQTQVEPTDKATILKYFLMLNTGGKIMSSDHLDKVKKII